MKNQKVWIPLVDVFAFSWRSGEITYSQPQVKNKISSHIDFYSLLLPCSTYRTWCQPGANLLTDVATVKTGHSVKCI